MENLINIEHYPVQNLSSYDEFDLGLSIACPLSPVGLDVHGMSTPFACGADGLDDSLASTPSEVAMLQGESDFFSTQAERQTGGKLAAAEPGPLHVCSSSEEASGTIPVSHCSNEADTGSLKKTKLEWTPELHWTFVQVVESLPADKQIPSRILEHMGGCGIGLTRANIASHLQKYRLRKCSAAGKQSCLNHSLPAPWPDVVLGVPCFPVAAHLPSALFSPPTSPMASHVPPIAGAVNGAAWAAPEMSPHAVPAPVAFPSMDMHPPEWSVPQDFTQELRDILCGKRKQGPLGLSLDCAAVMQQWNGSMSN